MNDKQTLAVPAEKVVVVVSATTEDGKEVSQSYEFQVPATAKDADILARGSQQFRSIGGFFVDDGNDLLFYLAYQMKGPIRFSINRIVIPTLMS
jgi:hypothetical protein